MWMRKANELHYGPELLHADFIFKKPLCPRTFNDIFLDGWIVDL